MSGATALAALTAAMRAAQGGDAAAAVEALVAALPSLGFAGAALMTDVGPTSVGGTPRPRVWSHGAVAAEDLARWRAMWRHDPRAWPRPHRDGDREVRAIELGGDGAAGVLFIAAEGAVADDAIGAAEVLAAHLAARLAMDVLHRRDAAQSTRLRRLEDAAVSLSRSLDEEEVVRELARQLRRALPVRALVVVYPDGADGPAVVAARFEGEREERGGDPLPTGVERDVVRDVVRTRRAVRVDDPHRPDAPAVIAAPMMAGRQLVGVTLARGGDPFSAADEELLRTMGAQAATAIVNARLYAESQRERRQGEALADVARAVSAELRLDDVLNLTLRHARALVRAAGGLVALRSGEFLDVVAADGSAEVLDGMWVPEGASLMGQVLRSAQPVLVNDAATREGAFRPAQRAAGVQRIALVPLVAASGPIGVLAVVNREQPFDDTDARVLQRLADHAAVAIANARLYEEVVERTREWAVAFDAVGRGMALLDPGGRVTRANARAAQLAGLGTAERLEGRVLLPALLGDEEAATAAALLAPALDQGVMARGTVRAPVTGRVFELLAAPHPHGGAVVTFDDVTAVREGARALARSEARYARLVEAAPDGICTMDADGRLRSVNPALELAAGRSAAQLIGHSVTALVPPADRDRVRALFAATMRGERARGELRYAGPDGRPRVGAVLTAPITESGAVVGALAIIRDVTEERLLGAQLLQQEKLAAVGQLVSGVAHELNNPLAAVMAFSQLLVAAPDATRDQRDAAEVIDAEARRAARIVSNLLSFARQHEPTRAAVDLNAVLTTVAELRRYSMRAHGVELVLELDPALPLTVGDEQQLLQVALNLVTNAEQALEEWSGRRRLVLATARDGDRLRVVVRDTGPGITAAQLDQVFNPFFTTKPVGQGTGLGLSISDGIVREHGGRLTVESTPGRGATFTIELPLVDPDEVNGQPGAVSSDRARRAMAQVATRTALVVDDEPALRAALMRLLQRDGFDVDGAEDGAEALERLAARRYDVVLLDLRMPRLGGDEAFERLRDRDPEQAARVLFVTGDVRSEHTRQFLESSGRPAVAKPFRFEVLREAVARIVDGSDPAWARATAEA